MMTVTFLHVETVESCSPSQVFCPNQNSLRKALDVTRPEQEKEKRLKICWPWAATEGLDKVIEEHGVDVIVGPFRQFLFCKRWCLSSIPFGYLESSWRPFRLHVVARANEEDKMIGLMSARERISPLRRVPDLDLIARRVL